MSDAVAEAMKSLGIDENVDTVKDLAAEKDMLVADESVDPVVSEADGLQSENTKVFNENRTNFRNQLSPEDLQKVKQAAPIIAQEMLEDPDRILSFGESVMKTIYDLNAQMLEEQKEVKIPEADAIVNGILSDLDGYSKKYKAKNGNGFFDKLVKGFRNQKHSLKSMVQDAKPIVKKLDEAQVKILDMENALRDNVARGQVLHDTTIQTLRQMVKVLATLEEIVDITREQAQEVEKALNSAGASADSMVVFKNKKYTVQEFREVFKKYAYVLSEEEKTWFSWRQQFFMYTTNISATNNIIQSSFALRRTCRNIREKAIPSARSQLVVWQQAEQARHGADMANRVNDGVNRLIKSAAEGTTEAVGQVAEANQNAMINEDAINTMAESLREQFVKMVEEERRGRTIRAKNIAVIEEAERSLRASEEQYQNDVLDDASTSVGAERKSASSSSDADSILGI